jgi:hypothetical protein
MKLPDLVGSLRSFSRSCGSALRGLAARRFLPESEIVEELEERYERR